MVARDRVSDKNVRAAIDYLENGIEPKQKDPLAWSLFVGVLLLTGVGTFWYWAIKLIYVAGKALRTW